MIGAIISATLLLVAVQANAARSSTAQSRDQSNQSLSALRGQTGWITLGFVSPDRKRWVVAVDPTLDYFSGVFEMLDRHVDRKTVVLPRIGERIRLTVADDVVIPDYANKGETLALKAPPNPRQERGGSNRDTTPGGCRRACPRYSGHEAIWPNSHCLGARHSG